MQQKPINRDALARHPLGYFQPPSYCLLDASKDPPETWRGVGEPKVESGFHVKIYMAYFVLLLDVAVEAYTDVLYSTDLTIHMLAFCVQLSIFVASFLGFCLLTSDIYFVQVAQYNRVFDEFGYFFLSALCNFLGLVGVRLWRISLIYAYEPHAAIWGAPGYYPVYILWRLVSMWYYTAFIVAGNQLMEPRLYSRRCMREARGRINPA